MNKIMLSFFFFFGFCWNYILAGAVFLTQLQHIQRKQIFHKCNFTKKYLPKNLSKRKETLLHWKSFHLKYLCVQYVCHKYKLLLKKKSILWYFFLAVHMILLWFPLSLENVSQNLYAYIHMYIYFLLFKKKVRKENEVWKCKVQKSIWSMKWW